MRRIISSFFIGSGIFALIASGYLIWQRNTPRRLAFEAQDFSVTKHTSQLYPSALIIKSARIELPIVASRSSTETWETTAYGVSYLASSPLPGDKGNSIMYGHNWSNLLGNLPKTRPGDELSVLMSDATIRQFVIKYTVEVTPDQTHILSQSDDTRLTLYTCSGFLDSKRFVVVATAKNDVAIDSAQTL